MRLNIFTHPSRSVLLASFPHLESPIFHHDITDLTALVYESRTHGLLLYQKHSLAYLMHHQPRPAMVNMSNDDEDDEDSGPYCWWYSCRVDAAQTVWSVGRSPVPERRRLLLCGILWSADFMYIPSLPPRLMNNIRLYSRHTQICH